MKKLLTTLAPIFILLVIVSIPSYGQEYDDIYFRKKDREKVESKVAIAAQQTAPPVTENDSLLNKTTNPEYLADNESYIDKDADVYFEEGYQVQNPSQDVEEYIENADVVVKHYYYGSPSTRYYSRYDDVFWNDPFLYQGNMFGPFYDPYYRHNAYYRPGWGVSFSIGNSYSAFGYNRWRYNPYGYYWGSSYYNSYYNYYDPFWCPPSYYNHYNQNNYFVSNNDNFSSRGIVRGKRTSRGTNYNTNGRVSSTTTRGRVATNDVNSGRISNGRVTSNSTDNVTSRTNSRVASSTTKGNNYSGFSRTSENTRSNYNSRNNATTGARTNVNSNRSGTVETTTRSSRNSGSNYNVRTNSSTRTNNNSRSNYTPSNQQKSSRTGSSNRSNSSNSNYNRSSSSNSSGSTSRSYNRSNNSSRSSSGSYNRSNNSSSRSSSGSYNRSSSNSRSSSGSSRSSSSSSRSSSRSKKD